MSTTQERADKAAHDLMTAVNQLAGPEDSEIVILMRGHSERTGPATTDLLFSWEWFCRDAEVAGA